MKLILVALSAFLLGIAFQHNYATARLREREAAERFLAELRPTPPTQPTADSSPQKPVTKPGRTWTYMPQTGRWVEHDSNVSAMRSIGGG